jgi:hypothetical protein
MPQSGFRAEHRHTACNAVCTVIEPLILPQEELLALQCATMRAILPCVARRHLLLVRIERSGSAVIELGWRIVAQPRKDYIRAHIKFYLPFWVVFDDP